MPKMIVNADVGAEMDQFRDQLAEYNNVITHDSGGPNPLQAVNVIEYICGEGDPPFVKYKLTLEAVTEYDAEEFEEIAKSHKETV